MLNRESSSSILPKPVNERMLFVEVIPLTRNSSRLVLWAKTYHRIDVQWYASTVELNHINNRSAGSPISPFSSRIAVNSVSNEAVSCLWCIDSL
jgi:hypothetical protein